ncbi:MAG: B12-binding domain-containing radical SAM protein [Deltaproteobacteria bacterium]|nr:B12-binding domain-containing radical SAM protein [Deltaproteobacteria bacterium]
MFKKKAYLIHAIDKSLIITEQPAFPFPVLGITTVAALFPEKEWEVKVVDEDAEPVDLGVEADLVGISTLTLNAPHAYELADHFRSRWIPVVMGGLHVTYEPEEALRHCNSVVLGEAEGIMPRLLVDFDKGAMKRSYLPPHPFPDFGRPYARRDLLRRHQHRYLFAVQATRGCPHQCEYCSVPLFFGNQHRPRPVREVVMEIKEVSDYYHKLYVFFVDDNIGGTPQYAKELFRALIPLKIRWASFASLKMAEDPELLDLAAKSGCAQLFIGFESLEQINLDMAGKSWVRTEKFAQDVRALHQAGIIVQGAFIFGHDGDTKDIFHRTVEFVQKSGIEVPVFVILTPYPGTLLRRRLLLERRLLPDSDDWRKYDGSHVLFRPALMTPEELQEGYFWAKKYCCAPRSIFSRLSHAPLKNFPLALTLNFSMWRNKMRQINARWEGPLRAPAK